MDFNSTGTTTNSPTNTRSVFSCPYAPNLLWDLNGTTFSWILIVITAITSPATIILNVAVIIAVKQRKELKKHSNTLLSSLAVADLLVGAFNMPLSAVLDFLIVRKLWLEHVCMLDILNVYSMYCFSMCSLYHSTAIAWERYVAVVKWKAIVTKRRVKNLAITAWLLATFTTVPDLIMAMIGVDVKISEKLYYVWCVCVVVSLILIFYSYVRVYLGVRKRKISEISQVTFLIMAKLESKIAKTGAMLCAALVFSFVPAVLMYLLGGIFPVLHTSTSFLMWEVLIRLNSLANPLLYCCRHGQFRNAVLELLQMKKTRATQEPVGSVRYVRRKDPFGANALELYNGAKRTRSVRAASCELAVVSDCVDGMRSREIIWTRSMSAPTLKECRRLSSFDDFQLQQPSSIGVTTVTIHAESGQRDKMKNRRPEFPKDGNLSQGTANLVRNTPRSKSCEAKTSVKFATSFPNTRDTILKRPRTAPPCMH